LHGASINLVNLPNSSAIFIEDSALLGKIKALPLLIHGTPSGPVFAIEQTLLR
jgi:hypothetical protein